jgi:malonyl-CoA O-methyltransferase
MRVSALEGHAIWSEVYDHTPNPLLELERRTVTPWLPQLADQTFVDVACGTGRWARYAADHGAHVVGADFCAPMLSAAETVRNRCVVADVLHLPFSDDLADVTVCAFTAGYVESPAHLVNELARITCPGGRIMLSDVHPAALAMGWQRSFRRAGDVYEIEHYTHAVSAYLSAASDRGLKIEHIAEAAFGEPEREIFRHAGREAALDGMSRVPAVFAVLWRRA